MLRTAGEAAQRCQIPLWETAFLELAQPDLATAVQSLSAQGADHIIVTPYFLTMGIHLQRDLPLILGEISQAHPGIDLVCAPPLDGHPALIDILAERTRQAIDP